MFDSITTPVIEAIELTEAGENIVIPASNDSYIYVRQILLVATDANEVLVNAVSEDSTTTLSVVPLAEGAGFILENTSPDYPYLLSLNPGQSLSLDLQSSGAVKGHIIYGFRK